MQGRNQMIDGKRLKDLRTRAKISSEELGKLAGVTRQQIARYEANQTDITSETLNKIADFFGVTTDYLLGRSDMEQGYERKGHYFTIDIRTLVEISPVSAARLIKAIGVGIEPNPLLIDIPTLLEQLPPSYVARFIKEMGIAYELKLPPSNE
jgi:transcriptional regulator with XRE-family HTH domain